MERPRLKLSELKEEAPYKRKKKEKKKKKKSKDLDRLFIKEESTLSSVYG